MSKLGVFLLVGVGFPAWAGICLAVASAYPVLGLSMLLGPFWLGIVATSVWGDGEGKE